VWVGLFIYAFKGKRRYLPKPDTLLSALVVANAMHAGAPPHSFLHLLIIITEMLKLQHS